MQISLASRIAFVLGACSVLAPAFGQDFREGPAPTQLTYQAPGTSPWTSQSSHSSETNPRIGAGTNPAAFTRPDRPGVPVHSSTFSPVITSSPLNNSAPYSHHNGPVIGTGPALVEPVPGAFAAPKNHGPSCGCSSCSFPGGVAHRTANWFGGLYGLVMTRDFENKLWLSYDSADIRDRVLTTRHAETAHAGGFETRFGRKFNCGKNAIEFVYWGVFPDEAEATVTALDVALDLDTILHFDGISYDPGAPTLVSTAFFAADRHRVRRSYQFQNVEVNMLANRFVSCSGKACGGTSRLTLGGAAGFRYMKFDDNFLYSTDPLGTGFAGGPEEVHYGVDVENHLIGFQLGGRGDYCLSKCFTAFVDTKVGIYGNHVTHRSAIYSANGFAEVSDAGSPYFGQEVAIESEKNDVSFVGELRTGVNYRFGKCWSGSLGYRAVGISGVALSTNQVPVDFIAALDSLRWVDTNGSLIMHGGYAGIEYNY